MKWWRWLLIVVAVAIVAGGAYWFVIRGRGAAKAEVKYDTVEVKKGNLVAMVNGSGSIAARKQVNLIFGTAGRVAQVFVVAGDKVEAGQSVMRLDDTDLQVDVAKQKLALANAENQLKKTSSGSTDADIAAAKAALKSAEESMTKVKAGPTEADIAAAKAALASAQEAYDKLRNGPTADDLRDAALKVSQSKNSLWASQNSRDDACSRGGSSGCDGAKAGVANAEIAVQLAESNLAKLKVPATSAQLQDASAKVDQARQSLTKLQQGPTAAEIAAAESQVAQAQAKLDSVTKGPTAEDVAIAKSQVENARLSLQLAQEKLANAILKAPFDGVILDVKAEVGQWATDNATVGILADLATLEIQVRLSEIDVVRAEKGQSASITLDAMSDTRLRGHVERVAPAAVIEQGVANYITVVVVDDQNPKVRPGMSANLSIITDRRQDVLVVPNRAVRSQGTQRVVAILKGGDTKNGGVEWIPVQVGVSNETQSEIKEGLKEGQFIVANPPNPPRQGQGGQGFPGGGFPGGGPVMIFQGR